jgi:four helix bundle protein
MHDFRRLQVWTKARDLAVAIDALTRAFPRSDRGVMAGQLRRAALSIPSNIAEGCGKGSRKETVRFLQIAAGSAREAESHLEIACALGYLTPVVKEKHLDTTRSIQRMLAALTKKLSAEAPAPF